MRQLCSSIRSYRFRQLQRQQQAPRLRSSNRHAALVKPIDDPAGDLRNATILIDLGRAVLAILRIMRLLVEILIVAAVIYIGWNKPYKEYVAQANKTITTKIDGLGGTLQKHQDSSVKRY